MKTTVIVFDVRDYNLIANVNSMQGLQMIHNVSQEKTAVKQI